MTESADTPTTSGLLDALLAIPVGPRVVNGMVTPSGLKLSSKLEVRGDHMTAVIPETSGPVNEGDAREFLLSSGQNPDDWVATGFKRSEYAGKVSVNFTFKRKAVELRPELPIEEIADRVLAAPKHDPGPTGAPATHGAILAIGDMQLGKADGDGPEGSLRRCIGLIDAFAERVKAMRLIYPIGQLHVAWLGDHIEGFESQGGANAWRTTLTLTEQLRLARRIMLYAVQKLAPLTNKLTMAAVPGNHGDAKRIGGKGITRYDDNHDTEALVSTQEAVALNPGAYGHVEFYVPGRDEIAIAIDVAGTVVSHAHGHMHRPGKHWEWWSGQAFGGSALGRSTLHLEGHLHHELVEVKGDRTFVQVPATESESTWWRHRTGEGGAPGALMLITSEGSTPVKITLTA